MKHIPLKHVHEALGAKMVDFAGFYMPVQYEGVNIEHETVRNGVGVFDVSHMGEFLLTKSLFKRCFNYRNRKSTIYLSSE
jgi:aminomethyltransferase